MPEVPEHDQHAVAAAVHVARRLGATGLTLGYLHDVAGEPVGDTAWWATGILDGRRFVVEQQPTAADAAGALADRLTAAAARTDTRPDTDPEGAAVAPLNPFPAPPPGRLRGRRLARYRRRVAKRLAAVPTARTTADELRDAHRTLDLATARLQRFTRYVEARGLALDWQLWEAGQLRQDRIDAERRR